MIYKVQYYTLAKPDGNVSQWNDTAFVECEFEDIEPILQKHVDEYCKRKKKQSEYKPVIIYIEQLKGHLCSR